MNVVSASDPAALAGLLDAAWDPPESVVAEVAGILADVRRRRDAAVADYARRYDDEACDAAKLRVPIPMLEPARARVSAQIARALEVARDRLTSFYENPLEDVEYVDDDGSQRAVRRRPLRSVAVYAQRSRPAAAVLAGAALAKMVGVPRVIVLSPPVAGTVSPELLFACALCSVDELYAVGGAQAIGAAAYGTESIVRSEKIVGGGSVWTTEAKRQVIGRCGIDALAGPGEVLVVADEEANSEYVVAELLAQAERPDVTRLAVVSESRPLLEAVAQLMDTLDPHTLERGELVGETIAEHCRLIAASSRRELLDVVNRFAPAYLCLQVRDAAGYLENVVAAGTVLVGDATPLVSARYLAGCGGVAPTSGTARFASGPSPADFTRTFSIVENSRERMSADAQALAALAELDSLPHHAQAARMRCGS